jgi:hypothetical protein
VIFPIHKEISTFWGNSSLIHIFQSVDKFLLFGENIFSYENILYFNSFPTFIDKFLVVGEKYSLAYENILHPALGIHSFTYHYQMLNLCFYSVHFILYLFQIFCAVRTGRIIIDIAKLHHHKSLHKQIFEHFIANNISLPTTSPSKIITISGTYESGFISCFGAKEMEKMDPAVLKANSQLPSFCDISFTDLCKETKIYSYALIILWAILICSILSYEFKTFTMIKKVNGKANGGEMI